MIQFRNIIAYMEARARLRRNSYFGYIQNNRESDRLLAFTTERDARLESVANREFVMNQARALGATIVVFKPEIVQLVGMNDKVTHRQAFGYGTFDELELYSQERDKGQWWLPKESDMQVSDFGLHTISLRTYGPGTWATPEDQGFYDVATGEKITNRREQIERLWALGFASRRGRPVHVAQERWSGSRQELEMLTDMAERVWNRQHLSEMARKMVAAYRGISRYVAWPGNW
jgi:hypothetical protein